MKTIRELFKSIYLENKRRGYKTTYIAIDLHGTLLRPTKLTNMVLGDGARTPKETVCYRIPKEKYYDCAIPCLQLLSANPDFKLILWTSSKSGEIHEIEEDLEKQGIEIDYVNRNPDFPGNEYADFTNKFCFDLLLDDKAGFDPEEDWRELLEMLKLSDWKDFFERNGIYTTQYSNECENK